jgi:hypothetical protein
MVSVTEPLPDGGTWMVPFAGLLVIVSPDGGVSLVCTDCGVPVAFCEPGFSGYKPSIAHMNWELSAPRSSLLGSPVGPGMNRLLRMSLTACWVPAGSPA